MVAMFIKNVLGVNQDHPGLFGKTAAYYGCVEQQGRLLYICTCFFGFWTHYLHKKLEIELWTQILIPKRIVEYLESVHVGEFMTGTMDEVKEQVDENMKAKEYRDPTQTLSDAPPSLQSVTATNVNLVKIQPTGAKFQKYCGWFNSRSNVKCRNSIPTDEKNRKKSEEVVLTNMETARQIPNRHLRRLR